MLGAESVIAQPTSHAGFRGSSAAQLPCWVQLQLSPGAMLDMLLLVAQPGSRGTGPGVILGVGHSESERKSSCKYYGLTPVYVLKVKLARFDNT